MPEVPEVAQRQVGRLLKELKKRAKTARVLDSYYEGSCEPPEAITRANVTKAYRLLMPAAAAPWGSLVVDSVQDRLEVTGIRDSIGGKAVEEAVWGVWQDNQMDAESKLATNASLIAGRSFALVWRGPGDDTPQITLDSAENMIVEYVHGSRRHRIGALRYWEDDDGAFVTLYRREAVYKFRKVSASKKGQDAFRADGDWWDPREVIGADGESEDWPLDNPWEVVPVVELPVNRRLKLGAFGYARGEYEHSVGLIDRIHLLTFLGLVVAFWMGFPLRGVIGDKIVREVLTDDDGNPLLDSNGKQRTQAKPPFDVHADSVFQLENPEAKIAEFKAADRANLSIYAELDQFAAVTKTPRHYMPMQQAMANLAADAIRASEGPLHAKVRGLHKPSLGEGWEEVLRVAGLMHDDEVVLSPRAELQWADHESRSLAERADAFVKLSGGENGLPWQASAELALAATREQLGRWASQRGSDAFSALLAEATQPTPVPTPAETE